MSHFDCFPSDSKASISASSARHRSWVWAMIMLVVSIVSCVRLGKVDFLEVGRVTMTSPRSQSGESLCSILPMIADNGEVANDISFCNNCHRMPRSDGVLEKAHYKWVGNQWFPPRWIPTYTLSVWLSLPVQHFPADIQNREPAFRAGMLSIRSIEIATISKTNKIKHQNGKIRIICGALLH